jgi:hypothetical protein
MNINTDPKTGETIINYMRDNPRTFDSKIIPQEDQMKIGKLYGGLPIYETSSRLTPKTGEIYLIQAGSSKRFCARFENIVNSISLT